jgi:hypothetical protein
MIALQSDVRVYLACGYTDMRKGVNRHPKLTHHWSAPLRVDRLREGN